LNIEQFISRYVESVDQLRAMLLLYGLIWKRSDSGNVSS